jgi:hypothetical protein
MCTTTICACVNNHLPPSTTQPQSRSLTALITGMLEDQLAVMQMRTAPFLDEAPTIYFEKEKHTSKNLTSFNSRDSSTYSQMQKYNLMHTKGTLTPRKYCIPGFTRIFMFLADRNL